MDWTSKKIAQLSVHTWSWTEILFFKKKSILSIGRACILGSVDKLLDSDSEPKRFFLLSFGCAIVPMNVTRYYYALSMLQRLTVSSGSSLFVPCDNNNWSTDRAALFSSFSSCHSLSIFDDCPTAQSKSHPPRPFFLPFSFINLAAERAFPLGFFTDI